MDRKRQPEVSIENLEGFDLSVLKRAVTGLTKFLKTKTTNDLLDTKGETVTLTFNLAKIPPGIRSKSIPIDIPYTFHGRPDASICIIVRDPQKKWKEKITEMWKLDGMNGMDVPKVIGLSKLKKNYPTMATKRELCRSYDFFLCDTRIIDQMPRILGRIFIDASKLPVGVTIKESSLLEPITQRLNQTFLNIRTGPSLSVKIGRAQDPIKHLYHNALQSVRVVSKYFNPSAEEIVVDRWSILRDNEIMSVHLTATGSPSLPIFIRSSIGEAADAMIKLRRRLEVSESEPESHTSDKETQLEEKEKSTKKRRLKK